MIVILRDNILGIINTLMLLSYKVYLSCSWCLLCINVLLSVAEFHFFYKLLQVFVQNFFAFDFFVSFSVISGVIYHIRILFETHCIFFAILHLSHCILFVPCVLRQIWVSSLCSISSIQDFLTISIKGIFI